MNLFDPQRPTLSNGRKQYFFKGTPIAAIPFLDVEPNSDGSYTVSIMLRTSSSINRGFEWHHAECASGPALLELLNQWRLDPEETMKTAFGWRGAATAVPTTETVSKAIELFPEDFSL